ncbi:VWA domain-containing protein [Verrucomicrobiota bacterium sgz303538]
MPQRRRRALLLVRSIVVALLLLALAGPAIERRSKAQAVVFVTDHSESLGATGRQASLETMSRLVQTLPSDTQIGHVSTGEHALTQHLPSRQRPPFAVAPELAKSDSAQSDLAAGITLARGLFPAGYTPRIVLLSDGNQTRGDIEAAARDAALSGVRIDTVPIQGELRPDVRAAALRSSKVRLHEGATVELNAEIESSLKSEGVVRLFENGIEVESRRIQVDGGQTQTVAFRRTPEQRNLYSYRVVLEGFAGDSVGTNNEALALVDVRGRPLLLYVEGEEGEGRYLVDAMAKEGLRLQTRPAQSVPESLQELNGYDGVILSDVSAHRLSERTMVLLRDYVEKLGGGLVMIGGMNSFGVGGYYRTPIEEILPVKIRAPDEEERQSVALAMVIDRSGSMAGQKLELCKSAVSATIELLAKQDYVNVVAFDSVAHTVVPMTKRGDSASLVAQVATIDSGGGTNIAPGMASAREALASVKAKVKHMIVLTDGQSEGSGYEALSAQLKSEGVTVSTVGVGTDADIQLLQAMAASGGGQCYSNVDPTAITRIFTQDAMKHMGKLVREEQFKPRAIERHLMLKDWDPTQAPPLLGYVKTTRKATAQIPLVTDLNDPLLAHWRFGLGKVTAFTSDCKSRWASLWITGWPGYSQLWGQILRETARNAQSDEMDLRLETQGDRARAIVDVMENAARFRNDASVELDVSFLAAGAVGSAMKPIVHTRLEQESSGRYSGEWDLGDAGVYLVRAQSGAQMVSGGLVRNVSGETSTGRINNALLERVAVLAGGQMLAPTVTALPEANASRAHVTELAPLLLALLLLLFLVDVVLRRWDNVLGLVETVQGLRRPTTGRFSESSQR